MSEAERQPSDESAELCQLSTSRFMAYRGRTAFNQFMPDWISLGQVPHPQALLSLSVPLTMNLAQCRALPANIPDDGFPVHSPRLFGNNPSCEVIARSSYILSNRMHSANYWRSQQARWFLKWCGSSVDLALLWAIFSMKTPTVRAVYETLLTAAGEFKDVALFTALYNLRSAVGDELATRSHAFRIAVHIGSDAGRRMLEIAQETSPRLESAGAVADSIPGNFDMSWIISKAAMQVDLPMMQLCISIGARMGYRKYALGPILENHLRSEWREDKIMIKYVQLLVQGGFFFIDQPRWPDGDTGLHLRVWDTKGLTIDRVIYECCPEGRRRLYRLFESLVNASKTRVNLAGVLTFAQDGPDVLKAYLQSHKGHGDNWDAEILEGCLSEAASLDEIRTASNLLEAGVDPNVPLQSQREHHKQRSSLWSPVARAAMAGSPEMLRLLLEDERLDVHSFLGSVTPGARMRTLTRACRGKFTQKSLFLNQHDHDSLGSALYPSEDSRRSEAIEITRAIAKYRNMDVDAHILKAIFGFSSKVYGDRKCHRGPSAFWESLCNYRLSKCHALLIPGLVENNVEFQIYGMDLLHLSIENGCSLQVARFLLQRGFEIHSRPCRTTGNTMLHSALLSPSMDRSNIVDLILQGGADYVVDGGGMTILEASLADDVGTMLRPQEYLRIFKQLFALGAPVAFPQGHRVGPTRRCLINLLLEANAEDDLIMQVVDAGTDVNDRGGGTQRCTTPLQQAIDRGRLSLAAELIRRGADVCAPPGEDGLGIHYSALQKACAANAPLSFIRRLVESGADVNEQPPARGPGLTSLECAARLGLLNLAQYLLDQGAKVNSLGSPRGCDPMTRNPARIRRTRPLDWAAYDGRLDMVSFLLEVGGRSGRPGTTGLDGAIDAATVHNKHFAVATVLQAWAAGHASSLLEAEAEWQQTNPDEATQLLGVWSEDHVSESEDCNSSDDSDDSSETDEPLT